MLASIDLRLFVQQQDDYVLQYMHGFPIHLFTEEKKNLPKPVFTVVTNWIKQFEHKIRLNIQKYMPSHPSLKEPIGWTWL